MTVSPELDERFRAAAAAEGLLDVAYDVTDSPVGPLLVAVSETGRIDQLSQGLCRSTDMAAVRARLFAYCAAGIQDVVRRHPNP